MANKIVYSETIRGYDVSAAECENGAILTLVKSPAPGGGAQAINRWGGFVNLEDAKKQIAKDVDWQEDFDKRYTAYLADEKILARKHGF